MPPNQRCDLQQLLKTLQIFFCRFILCCRVKYVSFLLVAQLKKNEKKNVCALGLLTLKTETKSIKIKFNSSKNNNSRVRLIKNKVKFSSVVWCTSGTEYCQVLGLPRDKLCDENNKYSSTCCYECQIVRWQFNTRRTLSARIAITKWKHCKKRAGEREKEQWIDRAAFIARNVQLVNFLFYLFNRLNFLYEMNWFWFL